MRIGRNARVYHFNMRAWAHRTVGAHERTGLYMGAAYEYAAGMRLCAHRPVYAAGRCGRLCAYAAGMGA